MSLFQIMPSTFASFRLDIDASDASDIGANAKAALDYMHRTDITKEFTVTATFKDVNRELAKSLGFDLHEEATYDEVIEAYVHVLGLYNEARDWKDKYYDQVDANDILKTRITNQRRELRLLNKAMRTLGLQFSQMSIRYRFLKRDYKDALSRIESQRSIIERQDTQIANQSLVINELQTKKRRWWNV